MNEEGRHRFRSKHQSFLIFFLIFAGFLGTLLIGGFGSLWYFSRDLPSLDSLRQYQPSLVTKVYSDNGQEIGQFYIERRVLVPLSQMPKELFNAIIAVEDSRFFEHEGIDPLGIFRAILANLGSFRIKQGASTITQQLVRSLFLSPEKSFTRKIREALLARKMERVLTKNEILEIYLNQIYFGHGAYGVQAAAKTYFGKEVNSLTLSESAFLAGLPKAPTDYSPYYKPDRAKQRQGVVLRRMVDEGFISAREYQVAFQEDLFFQKLGSGEKPGPYFLEYIRQYLASEFGETALYRGGLNVNTTMNLDMQNSATEAVRDGLRALDKRQGFRGPIGFQDADAGDEEGEKKRGSVRTGTIKKGDLLEGVVTEVTSKEVTVLAGGVKGKISLQDFLWAKRRLEGEDIRKDYKLISNAKPNDFFKVGDVIWVGVKSYNPQKEEAILTLEQQPAVEGSLLALDPSTGAVKAMVGGYDFEKSEFNRALYAKRQPGSAFKPVIFATALDMGFTPASIIFDSPVIFEDKELNKVWKPENYEKKFYGPITLREALSHSRNVATVKLLEKIGIQNTIRFARNIGISSPFTKDLSMALGTSSLTLLEITSAFGVFANEGVRNEPYMVELITDPTGQVLERHIPQPMGVVSKGTAYLITNMLEDVIQNGTGRRAKVIEKPLAGKTGTTNDFTDAWFVGYVKNLAAGVWVGFDDMRSLGNREAGARAALPIWIAFMREALDEVPSVPFEIPDDIVFARVDPDTGFLVPPNSGKGVIEVFRKGTEPHQDVAPDPVPVEFYNFDQSI